MTVSSAARVVSAMRVRRAFVHRARAATAARAVYSLTPRVSVEAAYDGFATLYQADATYFPRRREHGATNTICS
eukprot:968135-Lingulodinium_polyedra.AAC.1